MKKSRTTTAAIGFCHKIWGIPPKPTVPAPTKLKAKRPPATPIEEMAVIRRGIEDSFYAVVEAGKYKIGDTY